MVWIVVAAVVAAAVVARPVLLRRGKDRPGFAYLRGVLTPDAYTRLAARPGWSKLELPVSDGAVLNGLIRRPTATGTAPWVVFFPGNDRTQLERGQRVLEYLRNERDFGLLVVAYRGYDSSSGVPSPDAFAADGTRILDVLLKTEQVAPSRVHVVAFSLGGFVACSAVSAAAKAGQRVASLTLLASIGAAEMHTSLRAARLTIGDVYDVRPLLDGVPGPVLVIQGTADEALSLETSRDITRRLGARATFVELPGAHHEITDVNAALDHARAMIERNVGH